METYKIENLTFTYPSRTEPALRDINITIHQGEFVTLCGFSGSGKTTLLRQLKPSTAPHGAKSGKIHFEGTLLSDLSARDGATKIGFVFQSPDNQIVTDKVWHELAFGLESAGAKTPEIRLRVAEMASFFGIQAWFHKPVTELSGGQKQLLALASVMALQPSVLILDEPTSQLDPIAAGEFLAALGKINRELGVTIILTEHRLEEALPLSGRAIVMSGGKIIADGTPQEVGLELRRQNSGMFLAMPSPMRIWSSCNDKSDPPITVRDGKSWLNVKTLQHCDNSVITSVAKQPLAVDVAGVWFRYEKNAPDIIKGIDFTANYGEITAILGGNGTGKTTTLSLIAGLNTPYRGKVHTDTRVYALPQNPQSLFTSKTVREELLEMSKDIASMVRLCHLEDLLDAHPYDLSGGEQQRVALAKVLLLKPKILLLDEPTKGLDAVYKQIFAAILCKLKEGGAAVVLVSHDIEFCAEVADRCALFFDGGIVTEGAPREFFGGNSFYTTTSNRMARHLLPQAVTVADVVKALGGKIPPPPQIIDINTKYEASDEKPLPLPPKPPKLTAARKILLGFFGMWLFFTLVWAGANWDNLLAFIGGGREAQAVMEQGATIYITISTSALMAITSIIIALSWGRGEPVPKPQKRPLSRRTIAAAVLILLTIPATIYLGITLLDDRRFYFIAMLIILQTMLPFILVFESRKPLVREIVVIAVLVAIAVTGRSAFFMLPQFKPVVAMVIIAGVAFGGEAGFLVGAMTGFVSNMFFGQGPWTPWQMFAFGIIGFLAGILFRKGLLRRSPISLAVFGGLATFLIYGGIMNPASVIMWQPQPTTEMFLLAYIQGIPFDIIHAAATVFFLIIISRPMLEKLDRVKVKYGLVE
ncbi:MAG: ATP-binding cassette domain-containing protein [Defluviitaleaceae bacterium]|nr:ATP-binding cassette domain-containing protein [Defluviitaleaceae bacterium]